MKVYLVIIYGKSVIKNNVIRNQISSPLRFNIPEILLFLRADDREEGILSVVLENFFFI
jgi:hypothetical protein